MQDTSARPLRRRRSVLYMPAGNARALAKADTLDADTVIFDLEDSVDPAAKDDAREALRTFFRESRPKRPECVIRINALADPLGTEDLLAARACMPDAILLDWNIGLVSSEPRAGRVSTCALGMSLLMALLWRTARRVARPVRRCGSGSHGRGGDHWRTEARERSRHSLAGLEETLH